MPPFRPGHRWRQRTDAPGARRPLLAAASLVACWAAAPPWPQGRGFMVPLPAPAPPRVSMRSAALRGRVQQLRGSAADHVPETASIRGSMRLSSRSMRAIWDAVHVALLGAPGALPGPEQANVEPAAAPPPHEEPDVSSIAGQIHSHMQYFVHDVQENLPWATPQPADQPPAALAGEASEPVPVKERLSAAPPPAEQTLAALAITASEVDPAEGSVEVPSEAPEELEAPEASEVPLRPPVLFSEEGEGAFQDFFLFIKDYGWSLRYRVCQLTDTLLDLEKPLQLEWVKLRRPLSDPADLVNASGEELFDWGVREPPSHRGFMYQVTRAVGSGVEAVINFFEGYGLKLLIQPENGIQLTGGPESSRRGGPAPEEEPRSVTHCWVQVMGMPFLPILQSIAFFNLDEVVMTYQA